MFELACEGNGERSRVGGRVEMEQRNAPWAKNFSSPGNRQGKVPFRPIPLLTVAATMAVTLF
jgi:hypothetical protein